MHRRHHIGMGIERAAGEADIDGTVVAEAPHQILAAAQNTDRQPAAQRLAIGHHVGAHAEIFLRTAHGEAEADEYLVEDQHDPALGADRSQPLQPFGIGGLVAMAATRELSTSAESAGALAFGCSACNGLTSTQAMSRRLLSTRRRVLRHVVQGVGLARRHRISDAGLNVAPPAVIGAAEANEMGAARVIAREPDRLHHRFGAGHVERYFVESGNLPQALDVVSRSPGDRGRAPGRDRERARRRARCIPCRSRCRRR